MLRVAATDTDDDADDDVDVDADADADADAETNRSEKRDTETFVSSDLRFFRGPKIDRKIFSGLGIFFRSDFYRIPKKFRSSTSPVVNFGFDREMKVNPMEIMSWSSTRRHLPPEGVGF